MSEASYIAICKGKGSDDSSEKFIGTYEKVLADVIGWCMSGYSHEPMVYDPEDPRLFWYPEYPDDTEVVLDGNGRVVYISVCDGEGPVVEIDEL